ncbi:hypothetical protein [Paenibacillus physcomitrellae]|uniref:Uncharacterized protein n=2 Tax=Paenibacillus physcomitrellae TaxID=1619311 RepID=A0ABQ1FNL0_9BACL|nr:hypothetical protein [Paenibacillus physcomitrellae]GGA22878.1 hypothetical protein GCM10010917_04540 [Paenibacillus physcomitrellae]
MLNTAVYNAAAAREIIGAKTVNSERKGVKASAHSFAEPSRSAKQPIQSTPPKLSKSSTASGSSKSSRTLHTPQTAINRSVERGAEPDSIPAGRKGRAEKIIKDNIDLPEQELTPSRTETYPSNRVKWTRWFFNVLLVIFIGLTIWLLWWGFHASPWAVKQGK